MKKTICGFCICLVLLAAGCAAHTEEFTMKEDAVREIRATSQMQTPVKEAVLSKEEENTFAELIRSLHLVSQNSKGESKGWQYYFVVSYEDGSTVSITLSDKEICVDEDVYFASGYDPKAFLVFFP